MDITKYARRALWMERVQQWRASVLSQRAFAREHGFKSGLLSYWAIRLAEQPPAEQAANQLVPIIIKRDTEATPPPALTLRSPRGWTITLPPSLPVAWLGTQLQHLHGTAYVLSNRRHHRIKLICWDGNGVWCCQRLDAPPPAHWQM